VFARPASCRAVKYYGLSRKTFVFILEIIGDFCCDFWRFCHLSCMSHPTKKQALKALQENPLSCQNYVCPQGKVRSLIYWNGRLSDTIADEKKKWK
jgi:hypothetical protein